MNFFVMPLMPCKNRVWPVSHRESIASAARSEQVSDLCFRKVEAKLGELTWVHKIFGGRLRSRVSCHNCGHNSDTFDRILDLSLDIMRADSLKDALRSFISPDFLKGADKYKCEKCVNSPLSQHNFKKF
jgi:ubiquitin C-terminal hydrolase